MLWEEYSEEANIAAEIRGIASQVAKVGKDGEMVCCGGVPMAGSLLPAAAAQLSQPHTRPVGIGLSNASPIEE